MTTLIENLKRLVEADPRSQSQIEKDAGMAVGQLSRLVNGKIENPSLAYLTGLAGALDITVAELLGETAGVGGRPAENNQAPGTQGDTPGGGGLLWLTHDQVAPSPGNPRKTFDPDKLAELADSIHERGLIEPLIVADTEDGAGLRYLHAGERRWRAIGLLVGDGRWDAGKVIPAIPRYADAAGHLALALIENLQREDLAPMDEARAFAALVNDHGWTTADIAQRIGKTRRHVQLRQALVEKLAGPVQQALSEGRISLASARVMTIAPAAVQESALGAIENENYGWSSVEGIRRNLTANLVPVGCNIFPLDRYDGELTEDPDDPEKRFFVDRAQFERLQRSAAEEKRDFMAEKWSWAEMIETATSDFSRWKFAKTKDTGKGGTVVLLHSDGNVEVIEGLVKPEPAKKQKEADKPAGPAVTKAHMIRCRNDRTRALQAEIAGRPDLALRAAVLALMSHADEIRLRDREIGADDRVHTVTIDAMAEGYAEPFKHLRREHMPDRGLAIDGWDGGKRAEAWEILRGLDDETVAAMHAALIGGLVGSWNGHNPGLGDSPLVLAMARTLEIDMAEYVEIDEAFLKTCRKDQLLAIARAANPDHDLRKIKTGELVTLILAEAKDGKIDGHVPPALNFGTPVEIEAAIAPAPAPAEEGGA